MSIARRYILYTFSLIFFIGCVFTPVKIISAYRREVNRMSHQIYQIHHSHIPFLISSLWLTHNELLEKQITGIVQFPYISKVVVLNDEGRIFSAAENDISLTEEEEFEKHYEALYYEHRDEKIYVGSMTLFIDVKAMKSDVFAREIPFIIYQLISAVLLAIAVSFLFQRLVGRHLRSFADFLKNQDQKTLTVPFSFRRGKRINDELESLASAVNTMRSTLHKNLTEKDMLLREIHHRIKNNIAAMGSLLRLQADSTGNQQAAEIINQTRSRLNSMSVLYDRLHSAGAVRKLAIKEYLPGLIEEITKIFQGKERTTVEISTADLILNAKTLSTMGIILNELVTNSLKHAFPAERRGKIRISIRTLPGEKAEMTYSDNGKGIPEPVIKGEKWGLGMMLIQTMVDQLGGDYALQNENGTFFRVEFPIPTDD